MEIKYKVIIRLDGAYASMLNGGYDVNIYAFNDMDAAIKYAINGGDWNLSMVEESAIYDMTLDVDEFVTSMGESVLINEFGKPEYADADGISEHRPRVARCIAVFKDGKPIRYNDDYENILTKYFDKLDY